nr:septin-9-like [Cherax quadricarinatus]
MKVAPGISTYKSSYVSNVSSSIQQCPASRLPQLADTLVTDAASSVSFTPPQLADTLVTDAASSVSLTPPQLADTLVTDAASSVSLTPPQLADTVTEQARSVPASRLHNMLTTLVTLPWHGGNQEKKNHYRPLQSLSSLDVEVLQRLDKIVNVVPVVAKADTLTLEERAAFKERIRADLSDHAIKVYPLQEYEDLDDAPENMKIRERLPFAVVGSTTWHEIHGKKLLGRRSNWGLVEVENKSHNDFAYMRDMLIRTHMQDLIGSTAERHYENFRRARLSTKTTSKVNIVNGQDTDHMEDLNESKI